MPEHFSGTGTAADPWRLKTPPLSSDFTMRRDGAASPPLLVCQVGTTKLTYLARAIDDLHAMLKAHGDSGTVEALGRSPENPVGG